MLFQEVIKKIKTKKKTFILFSTNDANSLRLHTDYALAFAKNFVAKCFSICTGLYAKIFSISILMRIKIDLNKS